MISDDTLNRYVIIIGILCSFAVAFNSNALSVALPTIANDFQISNIMQNWIVNVYLLVIAITSVPFGKICGKYGLKRTLIIGLLIYIIGAVLSGIAPNEIFILLARIIQAVGSSILFVNVMAMITAQISPQKRGQAVGLTVMGVYVGLTSAPTIGGLLVQYSSWRSIFYITLPLIFISIFLLSRISSEWSMDVDVPLDVKGSILYMLGISLLMYGFTVLNEMTGLLLAVVGVVVLIIFAKYELKIQNPIYDIKLFYNLKYASSNIASFISYFATFVVTYILNYHFQYLNGLKPETTGIILIVSPLLMAIVAPFSGKLSDKIEPKIIASAGMAMVTIAMFILTFLNESTPLYMIIIAMILQGVGFGLFSSPNSNIILGSVEKKDIPTASASLSTVRTIGQSFSLGLLTLIFSFVMGNVQIVPSNYHLLVQSSHITMIFSTILCVIAVILSLVGVKSKT